MPSEGRSAGRGAGRPARSQKRKIAYLAKPGRRQHDELVDATQLVALIDPQTSSSFGEALAEVRSVLQTHAAERSGLAYGHDRFKHVAFAALVSRWLTDECDDDDGDVGVDFFDMRKARALLSLARDFRVSLRKAGLPPRALDRFREVDATLFDELNAAHTTIPSGGGNLKPALIGRRDPPSRMPTRLASWPAWMARRAARHPTSFLGWVACLRAYQFTLARASHTLDAVSLLENATDTLGAAIKGMATAEDVGALLTAAFGSGALAPTRKALARIPGPTRERWARRDARAALSLAMGASTGASKAKGVRERGG